jgi:hypothetical protein
MTGTDCIDLVGERFRRREWPSDKAGEERK